MMLSTQMTICLYKAGIILNLMAQEIFKAYKKCICIY